MKSITVQDFVAGDRIIVQTAGVYKNLNGVTGTVLDGSIYPKNRGSYLPFIPVELNTDINLHNCGGIGKSNHCLWLYATDLVLDETGYSSLGDIEGFIL